MPGKIFFAWSSLHEQLLYGGADGGAYVDGVGATGPRADVDMRLHAGGLGVVDAAPGFVVDLDVLQAEARCHAHRPGGRVGRNHGVTLCGRQASDAGMRGVCSRRVGIGLYYREKVPEPDFFVI